MGEAGSEFARSKFNNEMNTKQVFDLYQKLLKNNGEL